MASSASVFARLFIALIVALPAMVSAASAGLPRTILVVGDSLSAEYGLARGSGWVPLLTRRLEKDKHSFQVINASISGDTSSGGRARLPALLAQHKPAIVIIELGGNDALRGLPLTMTDNNISHMANVAKATKAKVLLLGMQMPPNYGATYQKQFDEMYKTIAQREKINWLPFFLAGIADDPDPLRWFQSDRIHPNAAAQPRMMDNVWAALQPLLK